MQQGKQLQVYSPYGFSDLHVLCCRTLSVLQRPTIFKYCRWLVPSMCCASVAHHVNARLQCTETLATVFDGDLWVQLSCASTLFMGNDSGVLEAAAA